MVNINVGGIISFGLRMATNPMSGTSKPSSISRTFYRRDLPETCVAFSSRKGRSFFASAMKNNGLKSFFNLMENHSTQTEPAYCGISTLVIALNALAVDPRQTWKGPWRWYEESMLNCCVDLDQVKQTGITLEVFNCLAICQGLSTKLQYVDSKPDEDSFRKAVQDACLESNTGDDDAVSSEALVDKVLTVSYSRKVLGQTGSGHFSPVAAFDPESDSVLILDTARFKYGAHWVKLSLLFEAMQPIDPDTGRSRGYVTLVHGKATHVGEAPNLPTSLLLRSEMRHVSARRNFKNHLETLDESGRNISYEEVLRFWTEGGAEPKSVWDLTQPQLKPFDGDSETSKLVEEVRLLIQDLIPTLDKNFALSSGDACDAFVSECRPNRCRTLQLLPEEVIVIIYLSCLDVNTREAIVFDPKLQQSDEAKEQLCSEAKLLRYAIEASDFNV